MKLLVVLCLVAAAVAAPSGDVQIVRNDLDNTGTGDYKYSWETSDGTRSEAVGELKGAGKEDAFYAVRGQYSYVGNDGVTYTVSYVADENGFRPTIEQSAGGAVPAAVIAALSA